MDVSALPSSLGWIHFLLIGLAVLLPFLVVGGYYFYRYLKVKRSLERAKHVTLNPEGVRDIISTISEEYTAKMELKDAMASLFDDLREIISLTSASFLIPTSDVGLDYYYHINLYYEVSEDFVESDLTNLRGFLEEDIQKSIDSVNKNIVGGPLNSSSSVKSSSRFIFPFEVGERKGAICLSSRKKDHFSEKLREDLAKLFEECIEYLDLFWKVAAREHRKFQSMVDSMRDGVFMVDEEFRFLIINPALRSILDLTDTETVNIVRVSTFFATNFSVEDVIAEVFALGNIKTIENINIGERCYCLNAIPVVVNSLTVGVVCLIQDVTQDKELEKMKRDFSAMIIHELRSPLSVIRGTSDFLLEEYSNISEEEKMTFVHQIRDSSDSLIKLVGDLLDSAKIESGDIEIFRMETDVNSLIREQVDYYRRSALQKKINLSFSLDESISSMNLDPDKIRQVINNLISNGLKYTESGGEVLVLSKRLESSIRIAVEDSGRGVADENKELIFEKYKQAASSGSERSTGLGLAISRGIAEAHGGKIWVEDNEPSGSRFIVELPY